MCVNNKLKHTQIESLVGVSSSALLRLSLITELFQEHLSLPASNISCSLAEP